MKCGYVLKRAGRVEGMSVIWRELLEAGVKEFSAIEGSPMSTTEGSLTN